MNRSKLSLILLTSLILISSCASIQEAESLYNNFISEFKLSYNPNKIQTGLFGANMQVELINDGPVTIFFDSKLDRK